MALKESKMIHCLHQLMPPDAVVDIGIGAGLGEVHQWRDWNVPLALLVDVDTERSQWAEKLVEKRGGWFFESTLLADSEAEKDFFGSSNRLENSVLAVDELQALWPNIQLREQQKIPSRRLDNLLASASLRGLREAHCIWGVVDCLAALPILRGAGSELERWSVVSVRVLLREVSAIADEYSSLTTISAFLEPLGYRCVEVVEENHPAVGHALFVRDWKGWLQPQITVFKQQLVQVNDKEKRIVSLEKERDKHVSLALEYQTEANKLRQTVSQYEQQLSVLQKEKDEQAKLVVEREQKIAQLTSVHSSTNDLQQQVQEQKKQLEQLSATKKEQAKRIDNYKKQVNDFQQQLQERDYRQKLLDEEFVKAEAQIELIKDVLLKEKAL